MSAETETVSGDSRFAKLANETSDAMATAMRAGLEPDECVCIVAAVIADYARMSYGDAYLGKLAEVITMRAGHPMPVFETEH